MQRHRTARTRLVTGVLVLLLVAIAAPVQARPYGAKGSAGEVRYGLAARDIGVKCVTRKNMAGKERRLCFHWAKKGPHRPPLTDANNNKVPDQVDRTINAFTTVWNTEIRALGYRMPLADSGKAAGQGPNNGLDVYLANIGANGDLGSCSGDRATAGRERRPAYCVVDNDFKEFGAAFSGTAQRRLKTLQATAAHEFFHAVQYAYTATMKNAEAWVTEGTATWMESRVFSTSVANHQYLELSALRNPETPLDGYGAWLFWQYLSERDGAGDKAIQQVWNDAANGHKTTAQVVTKLSSRYGSFGGVLADFGARTYGVEKFYANGSKYRKAVGDKRPPLDARHELNATRNSTDATGAPGAMRSLDMGARSISYVEIAAGKTGNLTVEVDLSTGTGWRLLLHRADGTFGNPITIAGGTHVVLVNQGDSVILVLGNGAGGVRTPKYRAVLP